MENKHDDQIRINPVADYAAPNLPTIAESKSNPTLLKKLPLRWAKKTSVIACMAFVGVALPTSCTAFDGNVNPAEVIVPHINHGGAARAPIYVTHPTEDDVYTSFQARLDEAINAIELQYRTHFGGSGSGPFYVVHITEQEALGIIRAKLEYAGLRLDANPPGRSVNMGGRSIGIDLFDGERRVGVTHVTWEMNNRPFISHGGPRLADEIAERFASQWRSIPVGVFFNPSVWIDANNRWWDVDLHNWEWNFRGELPPEIVEFDFDPPSDGTIAQVQEDAKKELLEQLNAQVQTFINTLVAQGIL